MDSDSEGIDSITLMHLKQGVYAQVKRDIMGKMGYHNQCDGVAMQICTNEMSSMRKQGMLLEPISTTAKNTRDFKHSLNHTHEYLKEISQDIRKSKALIGHMSKSKLSTEAMTRFQRRAEAFTDYKQELMDMVEDVNSYSPGYVDDDGDGDDDANEYIKGLLQGATKQSDPTLPDVPIHPIDDGSSPSFNRRYERI